MTSTVNVERTPEGLPRPPGVLRRFLAAHPALIDVVIVVGYVLGSGLMAMFSLWELFYYSGSPLVSVAAVVLIYLNINIGIVALLLRRTHPQLGLAMIAVMTPFSPATSLTTLGDWVALCFMLYATAVYGSTRLVWAGFAIAVAAIIVQDRVHGGEWPLIATSSLIFVMITTVLIGINLGNRRRYVSALVDRAVWLERDRANLAHLAVVQERERISREMHDIVAHSVSVMIALSEGSARTIDHAPEQAREAMQHSAETGRTALGQMRRLIGALTATDAVTATALGAALGVSPGVAPEMSTPEAQLAPQPGVADIAATITQFRQAGIEVHHTTSGVAPSDPGVSLAIHRVVQESLTNALRYAGVGAGVWVELTHHDTHTHLTVRDEGRVTGHIVQDGVGSGKGLRGLEERVRMYGGTITAGPLRDGGWLVEAVIHHAHSTNNHSGGAR